MDPAKRVRDVLAEGGDWIDVRGSKKHIKGYLKEFLFRPELTEAPVGSLSGGERSRLLLAREFAREANLLVLDEPTNDLDLETLDLLQEVIADYEGTVLIVSHDRDFLDRTVTVTLGLDGSGRVDIVAGGYEDWAKRRRSEQAAPAKAEGCGGRADERPSRSRRVQAHLQGPARSRPAARRDRAAGSGDRGGGGRSPRPRSLHARSEALRRADRAIRRLRAEKNAAEERWLEVAEMAETLSR